MTKKKPTKKRATKRTSRVPKGKMRLRIAVGIYEDGSHYSVALHRGDDPASELDACAGYGPDAIYVLTAIVDKPQPVEPIEVEAELERRAKR